MIYGIGTDLVEIARIEKILKKDSEAFLKRVCHENEIAKLKKLPKEKWANHVAKLFAGKEAISKAFGTGIRDGINFIDIEISNDELGKPIVNLHHTTKQFFDEKIKGHIQLSLSDEKEYALAFAIVQIS
ncbi:MAG: holo-ACP synthase [Alphaproteobacteria bacterium]